MVAAGATRRRNLPGGSIQWLLVKPWMCYIGQCAPHGIAASAWQLNLPAFFDIVDFVVGHNHS
jgi:hypothetical protein